MERLTPVSDEAVHRDAAVLQALDPQTTTREQGAALIVAGGNDTVHSRETANDITETELQAVARSEDADLVVSQVEDADLPTHGPDTPEDKAGEPQISEDAPATGPSVPAGEHEQSPFHSLNVSPEAMSTQDEVTTAGPTDSIDQSLRKFDSVQHYSTRRFSTRVVAKQMAKEQARIDACSATLKPNGEPRTKKRRGMTVEKDRAPSVAGTMKPSSPKEAGRGVVAPLKPGSKGPKGIAVSEQRSMIDYIGQIRKPLQDSTAKRKHATADLSDSELSSDMSDTDLKFLERQSLMITLDYSPKSASAVAKTFPSPLSLRKVRLGSKKKHTSLPIEQPQEKLEFQPAGLLTPSDSQTSLSPPRATVPPELAKLAHAMSLKTPVESKLLPQGSPLVWADSRQALTETVPYFKKPQGGCHKKDRHVYCFLFDNVGHPREYMDQDVIVARAGGSMAPDSAGPMQQGRNQSISENQVQAVLNDIAYSNPLVIIVGDRNSGCPTKMPHKYCVLGWYKPITVWAEKTQGKGLKMWTTVMYRFERLGSGLPDSPRKPWFAPEEDQVIDHAVARPLDHQTCSACNKQYAQLYLDGWMCLNEQCADFWRLDGVTPTQKLLYNPAWLLHRTPWTNEMEPASVKQAVHEVGKMVGDNLTKINTRGICCPQCGRCNSRRLFTGWVCESPDCEWQYFPEHPIIMPAALHTPWDNFGNGPTLSRAKHGIGVRVETTTIYGYKVTTWTIDGVAGKVVHAAANKTITGQPHGPDEMLAALQETDLGLERRRFRGEKGANAKAKTCKKQKEGDDEEDGAEKEEHHFEEGDMMTAFSMNYGMPYKFIANGASMSFDEAPWPVRCSRSVLNWAIRTFLGEKEHGRSDDGFNEELIFAYMEGQKLEYHDDGETGLGPTIGTLSLGGKSTMYLRLKTKHFVGCSKTGLFTAERPLPISIGGGETYQKRLAAWTELQQLQKSDVCEHQKRRRTIPRELGLYELRAKKAEDSIVVPLSHGDIIIMHGHDIQTYLEHKVVAEDHLRFALTCRTVLPNHLKPEELPAYVVGPDEYGYEGGELGKLYPDQRARG